VFAILAIVCFLLVALEAPIGLNLVALGLAFMAAQLLVGSWPLAWRPPR
jgi:hypothetical protein